MIVGCSTVGGVQILTTFFGTSQRFFETIQWSEGGLPEVVCSYRTWAKAVAGHQEKVKELQDQLG